MSTKLTLKARQPDPLGNPLWHDSDVLMNAFTHLAGSKEPGKAAMWWRLAGKLQIEVEAADVGKRLTGATEEGQIFVYRFLPEITIELSEKEARVFCKHVFDLPLSAFSKEAQQLNLGTLYLARFDWARQLDTKLPEDIEEDDDPSQSDEKVAK